MTQEHQPFDQQQFWAVVAAAARNIAGVLAAFGIIWFGLWTYVIQPQADQYIERKLSGLRDNLSTITTQLTDIKDAMPRQRSIIEVKGGGRLPDAGPHAPGDILPVLYLLRRNDACATEVRVQFWEARANAIATEYSYTVPAQQASPSFGFRLFSVRVRLPRPMRGGIYSYVPILSPDRSECPGQPDIQLEPSDFFEVSND